MRGNVGAIIKIRGYGTRRISGIQEFLFLHFPSLILSLSVPVSVSLSLPPSLSLVSLCQPSSVFLGEDIWKCPLVLVPFLVQTIGVRRAEPHWTKVGTEKPSYKLWKDSPGHRYPHKDPPCTPTICSHSPSQSFMLFHPGKNFPPFTTPLFYLLILVIINPSILVESQPHVCHHLFFCLSLTFPHLFNHCSINTPTVFLGLPR